MLPSILRNKAKGGAPDCAQAKKACRLRWDITHKCDVGCTRCFQPDDIPKSDLSHNDCLKILEAFADFLKHNNLVGELSFTGHPILRADFFDILKAAGGYQKSGVIKTIAVLGQASGMTEEAAQRLKAAGVYHYSFPLDGLEATHDSSRREGSFQETLAAIRTLGRAGIRSSVKLTISTHTADEVLEVMRLMMAENALMNFIQSLPCGAKPLTDKPSPDEYRSLLIKVLSFLDTLSSEHNSLRYSLIGAEHLFARLFYELGRWDEYQKLIGFIGDSTGCGKGLRFSVMPDGGVRARRFIAVKLGQLPGDSFQQVYESSELVRSLEDGPYTARKKELFEKCRKCPVVDYCGSGIGLAYQATGNPFAPTPMCWV